MVSDIAALDALYPLPPAELSRQWVMSKQADILPPEWTHLSKNGWHIAIHPDANVCHLQSESGDNIGWVIEPLAYLDSRVNVAPRNTTITLPVGSEFTEAEIDRALYGRDGDGLTNGNGFVGSWTAILFSKEHIQRIYLGVVHSIVYSVEKQAIATSHNLIPGLQRDTELSRAFDPMATASYYTFGLTAFIGLKRLLPNHYLDLPTLQENRHWPKTGFNNRISGSNAAEVIVEHARKVVDVLVQQYPKISLPLSAGRDSRAVLACLRPFVNDERISLMPFTSSRPNIGSETDVQIAVQLARIAHLPQHKVLEVVPRPTDVADFQRSFVKIGEAKCTPNLGAPAREKVRPPVEVIDFPGMAGETARAFYWGKKKPSPASLEPAALARCTHSPTTDHVLRAAAEWLERIPASVRNNPADVLDLAYIEQRMGCWEAPVRYLFPGPGRSNLSLMATALSVETMLRLPEDYRAAGHLQRDMVAYGWPELLELPFNQSMGLLRVRHSSQKLRRMPRKLAGAVFRRLFPARRVTKPKGS
ncbi:hypothetical protein [Vreelandella nanhaiensis]|uniref:Asparagine synthetase domain-containing protein n=1 Tax=Vreelandella nanhaiensis TaxID=1258546 RepID=A0A433KUP6_9GAMM|nr:hypothetical protein [Halomonas nanhaiensis]RUR33230.1 hypothetical protein ELY38_06685 [Halomonas nanhaiensis]